jgi:hypothetical protein
MSRTSDSGPTTSFGESELALFFLLMPKLENLKVSDGLTVVVLDGAESGVGDCGIVGL